jgi:dihydropyrimidine dehydrogenase (NAD+) subunit PreA
MRDVAEVKRQFPGHGLVVSVAAQGREEWLALVAAAEGAGADGVELVLPGDLATAEEVVGWVKQASSKPVWAKVAWDGGDARGLARVAAKAGAAAVTVAGGARLLWGVDLDRGCALPAVAGRGVVVTGGGAWLRPALLALVADVALDAEVARPVTASCGVASWQDAAEAMALGATVVQVGGEAVRRGVGLARELVDGLDDFLDAQGWGAVTDLVGRALPSLAGWAEVEGRRPVVARIDVATCVGCQLCQVACRDGGPDAVRLPARETAVLEELERALASRPVPPPAERVPFVDERVCTGCGLCLAVCPVDGCIRTGEPGR